MSQDNAVGPVFTVPRIPIPAARRKKLGYGSATDGVRNTLKLWFARWKQRRALAQLDDRMLLDIGVSRSQAHEECAKWFWQD